MDYELDATQVIPLDDYEDATQAIDMDDDSEDDQKKPVGFLKVFTQKGVKETMYPVFEGENRIGRHDKVEISIPIKALSKQHACIKVSSGVHLLYDMDSRNKSKRHKMYLEPNVRYELKHEDSLTFADVNCQYLVSAEMKVSHDFNYHQWAVPGDFDLHVEDQIANWSINYEDSLIYSGSDTDDMLAGDEHSSDIIGPTQRGDQEVVKLELKTPQHAEATVCYAEDSDEDGVSGDVQKGKPVFVKESDSDTDLSGDDSKRNGSNSKNQDDGDLDVTDYANVATQAYVVNDSIEDVEDDEEDEEEEDKSIFCAATQAYGGHGDDDSFVESEDDDKKEPPPGPNLNLSSEGESDGDMDGGNLAEAATMAYDVPDDDSEESPSAIGDNDATLAYDVTKGEDSDDNDATDIEDDDVGDTICEAATQAYGMQAEGDDEDDDNDDDLDQEPTQVYDGNNDDDDDGYEEIQPIDDKTNKGRNMEDKEEDLDATLAVGDDDNIDEDDQATQAVEGDHGNKTTGPADTMMLDEDDLATQAVGDDNNTDEDDLATQAVEGDHGNKTTGPADTMMLDEDDQATQAVGDDNYTDEDNQATQAVGDDNNTDEDNQATQAVGDDKDARPAETMILDEDEATLAVENEDTKQKDDDEEDDTGDTLMVDEEMQSTQVVDDYIETSKTSVAKKGRSKNTRTGKNTTRETTDKKEGKVTRRKLTKILDTDGDEEESTQVVGYDRERKKGKLVKVTDDKDDDDEDEEATQATGDERHVRDDNVEDESPHPAGDGDSETPQIETTHGMEVDDDDTVPMDDEDDTVPMGDEDDTVPMGNDDDTVAMDNEGGDNQGVQEENNSRKSQSEHKKLEATVVIDKKSETSEAVSETTAQAEKKGASKRMTGKAKAASTKPETNVENVQGEEEKKGRRKSTRGRQNKGGVGSKDKVKEDAEVMQRGKRERAQDEKTERVTVARKQTLPSANKDDMEANTQAYGEDDLLASTQVYGEEAEGRPTTSDFTEATQVYGDDDEIVPESDEETENDGRRRVIRIPSMLKKVPAKSAMSSPKKEGSPKKTQRVAFNVKNLTPSFDENNEDTATPIKTVTRSRRSVGTDNKDKQPVPVGGSINKTSMQSNLGNKTEKSEMLVVEEKMEEKTTKQSRRKATDSNQEKEEVKPTRQSRRKSTVIDDKVENQEDKPTRQSRRKTSVIEDNQQPSTSSHGKLEDSETVEQSTKQTRKRGQSLPIALEKEENKPKEVAKATSRRGRRTTQVHKTDETIVQTSDDTDKPTPTPVVPDTRLTRGRKSIAKAASTESVGKGATKKKTVRGKKGEGTVSVSDETNDKEHNSSKSEDSDKIDDDKNNQKRTARGKKTQETSRSENSNKSVDSQDKRKSTRGKTQESTNTTEDVNTDKSNSTRKGIRGKKQNVSTPEDSTTTEGRAGRSSRHTKKGDEELKPSTSQNKTQSRINRQMKIDVEAENSSEKDSQESGKKMAGQTDKSGKRAGKRKSTRAQSTKDDTDEESQPSETPTKRKKDNKVESTSATRPSLRRRSSLNSKDFKVMFTGVIDKIAEKTVTNLGGVLVDSVYECTHLVTDKVRRTVKFLCGLSRGIPIVNQDWLEQCKKANTFLDSEPFLLKDKQGEEQYSFDLAASRQKALEGSALQGYKVHVTNKVAPPPNILKDIIKCAGGVFLTQMPRKPDDHTVVISCDADKSACQAAIKASIPVVSTEYILTGLMRQDIQIDPYRLFTSDSQSSSSSSTNGKRKVSESSSKTNTASKRRRR
ncbi:uncharacterized protein LOC144445280 [Glandiceps talaboti]